MRRGTDDSGEGVAGMRFHRKWDGWSGPRSPKHPPLAKKLQGTGHPKPSFHLL